MPDSLPLSSEIGVTLCGRNRGFTISVFQLSINLLLLIINLKHNLMIDLRTSMG